MTDNWDIEQEMTLPNYRKRPSDRVESLNNDSTNKSSIHDWVYIRKLNFWDLKLIFAFYGMYLFFTYTNVFVDFNQESLMELHNWKIKNRSHFDQAKHWYTWITMAEYLIQSPIAIYLGWCTCTVFIWYLTFLEASFIDIVDWDHYYQDWGYGAVCILYLSRHFNYGLSKVTFFILSPFLGIFTDFLIAIFSYEIIGKITRFLWKKKWKYFWIFTTYVLIMKYSFVVNKDWFIIRWLFVYYWFPSTFDLILFFSFLSPVICYFYYLLLLKIGDIILRRRKRTLLELVAAKTVMKPRSRIFWLCH